MYYQLGMHNYLIASNFLFQANLPLLQADLLQCARVAHQTPQQYARQHFTLEACGSEPGDIFQTDAKECTKRRTPPDT